MLRNTNSPDPAGRTAWIFSDGKIGHEEQCLGVVEALGLKAQIKRIRPTLLMIGMSPWGPVARREGFGRPGSELGPPWPAFAFATGRTTIPYIRALSRRAGPATYTTILMHPRTSSKSADLIWTPAHDRQVGPNCISTLAVPHRFSAARLRGLRLAVPSAIVSLPYPRIACLIGGPNGDYRYSAKDVDRLTHTLQQLAFQGAGLMITPSRRTPQRLLSALRHLRREGRVLCWDGSGQNPYPDFLAQADLFVITADSVNMACEAAATGRPIYIFRPSGGSRKFDRFHAALAAHGASRSLPPPGEPLQAWSYEPLHSALEIADEIKRRWQRRFELLSGLVTEAS